MEELCEYKDVEKKKLILSMSITGIVMVIEVIGGIFSNSLALLSDAGHMFTHFFALLMSFVAIKIASKLPCHHRTFGLYRAEIIAALFNSLFLFGVTGYIFYESILRILQPEPILEFEMLMVAIIGLIVNIITVTILQKSSHEDLNVRGAYIHMIGDTGSSVAIIIGVVILIFTDWFIIDPLLAIGIGNIAKGKSKEALERTTAQNLFMAGKVPGLRYKTEIILDISEAYKILGMSAPEY